MPCEPPAEALSTDTAMPYEPPAEALSTDTAMPCEPPAEALSTDTAMPCEPPAQALSSKPQITGPTSREVEVFNFSDDDDSHVFKSRLKESSVHAFTKDSSILSCNGYIVNYETNNLAPEIALQEKRLVAALTKLTTTDSNYDKAAIRVGGAVREYQAWHYIRTNLVHEKIYADGNGRLEFLNFKEINEAPVLWKWQRISATVGSVLNHNKVNYTRRVLFSMTGWCHCRLIDGKEVFRHDFVIISLLRSRDTPKVQAATVGYISTGEVFFIQSKVYKIFVKCGWCALDQKTSWDEWKQRELKLFKRLDEDSTGALSIVYDPNVGQPLDTTYPLQVHTTRRPKISPRTLGAIYKMWTPSPGLKQTYQEMIEEQQENAENTRTTQKENAKKAEEKIETERSRSEKTKAKRSAAYQLNISSKKSKSETEPLPPSSNVSMGTIKSSSNQNSGVSSDDLAESLVDQSCSNLNEFTSVKKRNWTSETSSNEVIKPILMAAVRELVQP